MLIGLASVRAIASLVISVSGFALSAAAVAHVRGAVVRVVKEAEHRRLAQLGRERAQLEVMARDRQQLRRRDAGAAAQLLRAELVVDVRVAAPRVPAQRVVGVAAVDAEHALAAQGAPDAERVHV